MTSRTTLLRLGSCVVAGYTGGIASTNVLKSGDPATGALVGLLFGLVFLKRTVGAGDGLMWGGAFGIVCWFAELLLHTQQGVAILIGDVVCLGIPLGLTLAVFDSIAIRNDDPPISLARALVGGGFAGTVGGWAFGKWMEKAHFFPLIANIFNSKSHTLGVTLHFAIAITIGATFGLLFQRQVRGFGSSLGWGAAYGLLWWCVGALTLLPLLSRQPIDWSAGHIASLYGSLVGHVIYGLIVGLLYAVIDSVWLRLFIASDPLNREPQGIALRTLSSSFSGLLASIAGGLCFAIVMIANGSLSAVARLVGSTSLWTGFVVHMLIGTAIGATYGILFRYEIPDPPIAVAWGLVYGLLWWFIGALTVFPILLGHSFTWTLAAASAQLPSLVGHLLYGSATALCFVALERRRRLRLLRSPRTAARESRRVRPPENAAPATWLITLSLGIIVPIVLA